MRNNRPRNSSCSASLPTSGTISPRGVRYAIETGSSTEISGGASSRPSRINNFSPVRVPARSVTSTKSAPSNSSVRNISAKQRMNDVTFANRHQSRAIRSRGNTIAPRRRVEIARCCDNATDRSFRLYRALALSGSLADARKLLADDLGFEFQLRVVRDVLPLTTAAAPTPSLPLSSWLGEVTKMCTWRRHARG